MNSKCPKCGHEYRQVNPKSVAAGKRAREIHPTPKRDQAWRDMMQSKRRAAIAKKLIETINGGE